MRELRDLTVEEVSLVDHPSNASTDPVTGVKTPRARVALFKRDSDSDINPRKDIKKMKFTDVIKAAKTRDQIVVAVEEEAIKIAKRENISEPAALVKAWSNEAVTAYENAPLGVVKRSERKMMSATNSEAELDRRARKRMAAGTGQSYAQSVSAELEADPGLYEKYQKEVAAGQTYEVPEPVEYSEPAVYNPGSASMLNKRRAAKDEADDDDYDEDDDNLDIDKCVACKSDIDKRDKFCSNCGANLARARQAKTRV